MSYMRDQDPAMFEQMQAEALDIIRKHKVWFVFAVDEEMDCSVVIACPETVHSDTLTGALLYKILLGGVIQAAVDALWDVKDE